MKARMGPEKKVPELPAVVEKTFAESVNFC